MNNYYVYMYTRSVDSPTAKAGTPYYIGKGRGRRRFEKHSVTIPNDEHNVIVFENLLEMGAFIIERTLIRWYGRKDLTYTDRPPGILRNMTDGGDGGSGRKDSDDTKQRRGKSNTGKRRTIESKNKISAAVKAARIRLGNWWIDKKHSDDTKQIMSAKKKGKSYEEIFGPRAAEMRERRRIESSGIPKGPQCQVICPHCGKEGGTGIMKRWHGDRCKYNTSTEMD